MGQENSSIHSSEISKSQKNLSSAELPSLTNSKAPTSSKPHNIGSGGKLIRESCLETPSLDSPSPTYSSKLALQVKSIDGHIQVARQTPLEPAAESIGDPLPVTQTQSALVSFGNALAASKTSRPTSIEIEARTSLEISNSLLGNLQPSDTLPTFKSSADSEAPIPGTLFSDALSASDTDGSSPPPLTALQLQNGLMQGQK